MTPPDAQIEAARNALAESFRDDAKRWRSVAAERPHDTRLPKAADAMEVLVAHIRALPLTDPTLMKLAGFHTGSFWFPMGPGARELARNYEYGEAFDPDEFLKRLAAEVESHAEGGR